jgi:hypothetical protein
VRSRVSLCPRLVGTPMSEPAISYVPRPDASSEGELAMLADVYSFILRCAEARQAEQPKASSEDSGEDARKEDQHASGAASIPSPFLDRNTDSLPPERPNR